MNKFLKALCIRALRSFFQALASTIPVGVVITPIMIQTINTEFVYVVLAWIATALLHSLASVITSIATGLPEAEYAQQRWMDVEPPEDSEVNEDAD